MFESRACATSPPNVDSLKASVELEWANMSGNYIRKVCSKFRPRIEAVIASDGNYMED